MIDLNTCKPGDKLRTKSGKILTYIEKLPENDYYDHKIMYPNGSFGTRVNDGHVFRNPTKRLEEDEDVIEIIDKNSSEFKIPDNCTICSLTEQTQPCEACDNKKGQGL